MLRIEIQNCVWRNETCDLISYKVQEFILDQHEKGFQEL
jgi:hypothetical protein